jgi:hypothetical protein
MRSRGEHGGRARVGGRRAAEWGLRGAAVAALGVALWQRLAPAAPAAAGAVARADEGGLGAALARWTAAPTPAADVRLDTVPGPAARAWLAALAAAGTRVTWGAARAPALAATAERAADPAGGLRLLAAAPHGAAVRAADALGVLDSGRAGAGRAGNVSADASIILALPDAAGMLRVRVDGAASGAGAGTRGGRRRGGAGGVGGAGGTTVRVATPNAAPRLGAVLVVAHAGWEGRFVAAALEERGWAVRTRFAIAPRVAVGDARGAATGAAGAPAGPAGPPPVARLDTATLAAVVALDSTAAPLGPALARYVRAGGGLVLAGDAARAPALAPLAAAAPGPTVDDSSGAVAPLARPRPDAVPLARRPVAGAPALVAAGRRVGAGRVVQLADLETWRRRFRPDAAAPAAHRAWWAQAVAAAAYAPAPRRPAPRRLTRRRRAPRPPPIAPRSRPPRRDRGRPRPAERAVPSDGEGTLRPRPAAPRRIPDAVLIPLALAALLTEVASRRLRGAA